MTCGARPVTIAGAARGQPYPADEITNRARPLQDRADHRRARGVRRGGVKPSEVDFAEIYDCFTFEVLQQIEEAGFCERGEGGEFIDDVKIGPGGDLPVNTHGGLLAEAHVLGMSHIVEAVRQLRGDAGRPPDRRRGGRRRDGLG